MIEWHKDVFVMDSPLWAPTVWAQEACPSAAYLVPSLRWASAQRAVRLSVFQVQRQSPRAGHLSGPGRNTAFFKALTSRATYQTSEGGTGWYVLPNLFDSLFRQLCFLLSKMNAKQSSCFNEKETIFSFTSFTHANSFSILIIHSYKIDIL